MTAGKTPLLLCCALVDVTECGPTTCLSGGTCVELVGGGTECQCPEGYSGADCCQSKINSHQKILFRSLYIC